MPLVNTAQELNLQGGVDPQVLAVCLAEVQQVEQDLTTLHGQVSRRLRPALCGAALLDLLRHYAEVIRPYAQVAFDDRARLLVPLATYVQNTAVRIRHYLAQMRAHYVANIRTALNRLDADWNDIDYLFFRPDWMWLVRLVKITSSGSDLHKGGQQVLILTFEYDHTRRPHTWVLAPLNTVTLGLCRGTLNTLNLLRRHTCKLIYKPSDVELDCRLAGRTRKFGYRELALSALGLSQVPQALSTRSLSEILNDEHGDGREIPTYRILPKSPGSALVLNNHALGIRASYGYIEYLSHEPADYQFSSHNELQDFFRLFGRELALTLTFSVTDLHCENLIVHEKKPYLIDLEFGLRGAMAGVNETNLISATYAPLTDNSSAGKIIIDGSISLLDPHDTLKHNGQSIYVGSQYASHIYQGFVEAMLVISADPNQVFSTFLQQPALGDTVGRYMVVATDVINGNIGRVYSNVSQPFPVGLAWHNPTEIPPDTTRGQIVEAGTQWSHYHRDIENCDFPCYYRRLSSTRVLDSRGDPLLLNGAQVQLPASSIQAAQAQLQSLANPLTFRQYVCASLEIICRACRDTAANRTVTVQLTQFQKNANADQWQ